MINLIVANPAGNTTIFVLDPVTREKYQEIANRLLEMNFGEYCNWAYSVYGEQVSFVLAEKSKEGYPSMEMCGLEFCGNASRAFAYYQVAHCHADCNLTVSVSGCSYPLRAKVDIKCNEAKIQMPVPTDIETMSIERLGLKEEYPKIPDGVLVNMDGISHLVLKDVKATEERFDVLKKYIYSNARTEIPAFGVMFIDSNTERMTPVVYVKDVDTTYFEGSCASGTTAASYAMAMTAGDGEYNYTFIQPKGTLYTHVSKIGGEVVSIELRGNMELSETITIEI